MITKQTALVAFTAATLVLGTGVAVANTTAETINNNEEAIAALDEAQNRIDEVRTYLNKSTPTNPPTTTPKPPTSTPTNPPANSGNTAAEKFNWGPALAQYSDEFNYSGPPNSDKWRLPEGCWTGHAGNGKRCAKNSVADGSKLVMTGESNGDTGWMRQKMDARGKGRWEARVRSSGKDYHPLLLVWPTSDKRVQDGEYDWLENGAPGEACAGAFLHYPGETPKKQEGAKETNCGTPLSEWHNVAFEWTTEHLKGFIDGKEWFSYTNDDIEDMPVGNMLMQLDNFGANESAKFEADWIRTYAVG